MCALFTSPWLPLFSICLSHLPQYSLTASLPVLPLFFPSCVCSQHSSQTDLCENECPTLKPLPSGGPGLPDNLQLKAVRVPSLLTFPLHSAFWLCSLLSWCYPHMLHKNDLGFCMYLESHMMGSPAFFCFLNHHYFSCFFPNFPMLYSVCLLPLPHLFSLLWMEDPFRQMFYHWAMFQLLVFPLCCSLLPRNFSPSDAHSTHFSLCSLPPDLSPSDYQVSCAGVEPHSTSRT